MHHNVKTLIRSY